MSATDDLPKIFKVTEVASYLDCAVSTVYRLIDDQAIRVVRVGRKRSVRITEDALRAYLEGRAA